MYGITADELHEKIIEDLNRYCKHMGYVSDLFDNALERESGRPIEQTIKMVMTLAIFHELRLAKERKE